MLRPQTWVFWVQSTAHEYQQWIIVFVPKSYCCDDRHKINFCSHLLWWTEMPLLSCLVKFISYEYFVNLLNIFLQLQKWFRHCLWILQTEAVQQASQNAPIKHVRSDRIWSRSGGKHWPEAGWMILAHWFASGPDPCGQNLTQSASTKLDQGWFCWILFGTCVKEQNRVWK